MKFPVSIAEREEWNGIQGGGHKMGQFLTKIIGGEYQEWSAGDTVLLRAPTGTGKTHFILHTLLPYAMENGEYILYLANRRILKEQLEADISEFPLEQQPYINVELYQKLDEYLCGRGYDIQRYKYIICDEAHYFSSDSLFNTRTEILYPWLSDQFRSKIMIYISATPESVGERIRKDWEDKGWENSPIYRWRLGE